MLQHKEPSHKKIKKTSDKMGQNSPKNTVVDRQYSGYDNDSYYNDYADNRYDDDYGSNFHYSPANPVRYSGCNRFPF
jgi:hypothetical protein